MGIAIRTFGSQQPSSANRDTAANDRPKAEFWLNFGYVSDMQDDDGTYRFVSLVTGVPMDTLETLPVNSRKTSYAQFNQARNELRDDLLVEARKLAPGADIIGSLLEVEARHAAGDTEYTGRNILTYQIRRVSDETAAPTGDNPFRRK